MSNEQQMKELHLEQQIQELYLLRRCIERFNEKIRTDIQTRQKLINNHKAFEEAGIKLRTLLDA